MPKLPMSMSKAYTQILLYDQETRRVATLLCEKGVSRGAPWASY
jgi:hypothetical protein